LPSLKRGGAEPSFTRVPSAPDVTISTGLLELFFIVFYWIFPHVTRSLPFEFEFFLWLHSLETQPSIGFPPVIGPALVTLITRGTLQAWWFFPLCLPSPEDPRSFCFSWPCHPGFGCNPTQPLRPEINYLLSTPSGNVIFSHAVHSSHVPLTTPEDQPRPCLRKLLPFPSATFNLPFLVTLAESCHGRDLCSQHSHRQPLLVFFFLYFQPANEPTTLPPLPFSLRPLHPFIFSCYLPPFCSLSRPDA